MNLPRFISTLAGLTVWIVALGSTSPRVTAAGTALAFDGVDDGVTFGLAPGLGSRTFTIEAWFRRDGVGTSTFTGRVTAIPLVSKGRGETDGDQRDLNYFLGIRTRDGVLVADFEEGAAGLRPGRNHSIAGKTLIRYGAWYHAAATYDGTKWSLYLNGQLEAQKLVGLPVRENSIQHAALGTTLDSRGTPAGFFKGVLDEVRIWNYARSAQDISANRDVEISTAPGLLGRWGLNEAGGTIARDSSGNGFVGTFLDEPAWVSGFQEARIPTISRGPYLQSGTPTSIIVRWRTDAPMRGRVRYGNDPANLNLTTDEAAETTEHEIPLTGLTPGTQYFYSIGTASATLATGTDFNFFTAPPIGSSHPTRIWVLGDSGTANRVAKNVREGYRNFAGDRRTDVWLMLGDNAYVAGTDAEYQTAVFEIYPDYLRQTVLWSALGNHETNQAINPDVATTPYFNIFSFPMQGEAGGVPSGTEKYYSFDYGRIHFIALDSMTSDRSPGSAMLTWLQTDLESTTQDWIIAFWHHPPYTKGSHDSDREYQLIEMRENVVPILEAGGVDLVLTGHSHCYERSFLINGHYGLSPTFEESMKLDGGSGRENETGAYAKPGQLAANQGTVYAVAGNGGQATYWVGGSLEEFNPNPHPAMFYSALHPGSMVIDIEGNRLTARMIRDTGAIDDSFTIVKNVPNQPPVVQVTSPANSARFAVAAEIKVAADASDRDGTVAQIDFYANDSLIGVATAAPYSITWSGMPAGAYALTAVATDNLGATVSSAPATISVDNSMSVPEAPSNLSADASSPSEIDLTWTDNSDNETGFVIECSKNGNPFRAIATVGANTTHFQHTGRKAQKLFRYRVQAVNAAGTSAHSNPASAKTRRK